MNLEQRAGAEEAGMKGWRGRSRIPPEGAKARFTRVSRGLAPQVCRIPPKYEKARFSWLSRGLAPIGFQLVDDVLDLAKIDAGKIALQSEPVSLSRLVDEVFSTFRLVAADKGIELVNRTADVPTVLLDEHRFRQILFNLIGNAVKFTERGTVAVAATCKGDRLDVSVSDTGCGIAPDLMARIFDPFVQARDPRHSADRVDGTGLGLSICRRLVDAMGGELDVKSELGKGSTFSIVLPGVKTENDGVAKGDTSIQHSAFSTLHSSIRVLVVDDSSINREVLASLLAHMGVTLVDQACDGGEALSMLGAAHKAGKAYDIVFTDLWMPNVNGIEFIEKLRDDSRFRSLPVYAVTADAEFQRDDRNKLFTGILLKPLTYAKLQETFASRH